MNGSGQPLGYLRIRRLGVRVPPSAPPPSAPRSPQFSALSLPGRSHRRCHLAAFGRISHPGSLVEAVRVAVHLAGVQVPVQVQRRGDAGMTHDLDFSPNQRRQMIQTARELLADTPPVTATLGRIGYHPEAIVLAVTPTEALVPIHDAARTATAHGRGNSHEQDHQRTNWMPHVTICYSTASPQRRSSMPSAWSCPAARSRSASLAWSSSTDPNATGTGPPSAPYDGPHQLGPSAVDDEGRLRRRFRLPARSRAGTGPRLLQHDGCGLGPAP
jgi:hypothetical protein